VNNIHIVGGSLDASSIVIGCIPVFMTWVQPVASSIGGRVDANIHDMNVDTAGLHCE